MEQALGDLHLSALAVNARPEFDELAFPARRRAREGFQLAFPARKRARPFGAGNSISPRLVGTSQFWSYD